MNGQNPDSGITFLKTNDLEKTTFFYTEIMDFRLTLKQAECRIFQICENCYLGFCLTESETGSDEIVITIEMQDVDGFYEYLVSKDVHIKVPPRHNDKYLIYQMFLHDPNGYLLEIQRFQDPDWKSI
jgi:catechol 2,3-dioxygenase-like lactoylglutathione lyase family enzyme